eukprot:CAMPEP_0198154620 /NCGR_PEP_ID=MMETSP1443-20131203/68694_1 /TAXON_ID=186043 /ORGANISM="Entomoneis sp., Strain CCMP2396" /LENGTH=257 /DNA_ID=CAMNT_0043821301 /DNA_START=14 /DNA_END=787 /DNA_ORIENTATION=-
MPTRVPSMKSTIALLQVLFLLRGLSSTTALTFCHKDQADHVFREFSRTTRGVCWGKREFYVGKSITKRNGVCINKLALMMNDSLENKEDEGESKIEEELERLQEQFALIEALEARNEAQLDSFVDEQDQWESMEEEERILLESKACLLERMGQITSEMLRMLTGAMTNDSLENKEDEEKSKIEEELERLQEQFALIEALEARNEAQLDSFVNEQYQWESIEEEERILLESKACVLERMEQITSELLQMWMGAKSIDG